MSNGENLPEEPSVKDRISTHKAMKWGGRVLGAVHFVAAGVSTLATAYNIQHPEESHSTGLVQPFLEAYGDALVDGAIASALAVGGVLYLRFAKRHAQDLAYLKDQLAQQNMQAAELQTVQATQIPVA